MRTPRPTVVMIALSVDGDHEHAEEAEHAATQQVNEELPEEAQHIMLHRIRGKSKERKCRGGSGVRGKGGGMGARLKR